MKNARNILFFLPLFIIGCSGQVSKNKIDNINGITNESFRSKPVKSYKAIDDFVDSRISDSSNVLRTESIAKLSLDDIKEERGTKNDIMKVLVLCYRSKFEKAFRIIDRIYNTYKKNPIYWSQVGSCYLLRGSKRKALLYYNKAREVRKNYAPPVNNIGVIFQKTNFDQKAMKAYEEANRISPFSLTPLFNLAQIYIRYGLKNDAKRLFESLKSLNPDDEDIIFSLGFLKFIDGNFKEAVSFFKKIGWKYKKNPRVGSNIAYALILNGQADEALDLLNKLNSSSEKEVVEYISSIRRFAESKK